MRRSLLQLRRSILHSHDLEGCLALLNVDVRTLTAAAGVHIVNGVGMSVGHVRQLTSLGRVRAAPDLWSNWVSRAPFTHTAFAADTKKGDDHEARWCYELLLQNKYLPRTSLLRSTLMTPPY
jgi:hypothetical protein